MTPQISVIIPCYNQSAYLPQAIDSALGQTYQHVQVVVVDDGSSDATPEVAARYANRIRYVRRENGGLSAARNTGILESSGEFLHFLDSDDYLHPEAFRRVVDQIESHPGVGVVYGDCEMVDEGGHHISVSEVQPLPPDAFHTLLAGNRWPCHCAVVSRAAVAQSGVFDTTLRSCEDWDLWIRVAMSGAQFVRVPHVIGVYRRYPGSMSGNAPRMWHNGNRVLLKNSQHHCHCVACADSLRSGRRWVRDYCVGVMRKDVLSGGRKAFKRAVWMLLRHPSIIRPSARDAAWRVRDHLLQRRNRRSLAANAAIIPNQDL